MPTLAWQGVECVPNLRWLDVSDNSISNMVPAHTTALVHQHYGSVQEGLSHMVALQWLDCHNNDLSTLEGLGVCVAAATVPVVNCCCVFG